VASARRPPTEGAAERLRRVRATIDSGWPAGLTVLAGDDVWHLDRVQRALLDALVPAEGGEFALTVYGDDKVPVSSVVGAARSIGMFAPRRVVLVRDANVLEGEPDTLAAYAKSPPSDSHLVIRAPALDQRRKIGKILAGAGTLVRLDRGAPGEEGQLVAEVRSLAKERDLQPEDAVVHFLLEATAGELYAVVSELDKLRAWAGSGDGPHRITLAEARDLVSAGSTASGWEVADAIAVRNVSGAMSAARHLLSTGEEPLKMLGGIAWRTRAMVQAKALLEDRVPVREVGRRVRLGWGADRILDGLRRYSMEELRAFPYHVAEADRALKSRGLDPGAIFERMVSRMVERSESGADRWRENGR
jgi:DNA polymerase-3 subunit delta